MTARKRKDGESFAGYRANLLREAWEVSVRRAGNYMHVSTDPDRHVKGTGQTYRKPK
jgi:hypothetical protein